MSLQGGKDYLFLIWKSEQSRKQYVFACRLPDRKRKNIKVILDKYGLEEFDEYMLLKRSGARLPIDSLEFIDPLLNAEE